jgi:chaperonin GroEL
MHATRAAVEEGILPGGGVALLRAVESLKRVIEQIKTNGRSNEQIHGRDVGRVAVREGAPGLGGRSMSLDHVLGDA